MSTCANTPEHLADVAAEALERDGLGAEPFHCTTSCQCVSHRNGTLTGAFGGAVLLQSFEIDAGGAVEDHPEGVDAGAAPRLVGAARVDELA